MKSQSINTTDGSIFYRKNIINSSAALVCLHGAGADSKIFLPMAAELQGDISVIIPDLPAHGQSEFSGIPSLQDYINAVIEIFNLEKITSFIPIGFSMGGAVVFELYKRFKERIPALIFISSSFTLPVSAVVFDLIKNNYATFCDFLVKFLYSRNAKEPLRKLSKQELLSMNPAIIENDFRICSMIDYRSELHSLNIPVLIIANRKDRMVPISLIEEFAQSVAHSKLVAFEGEGHMPHLENPEATAEEIINFITNRA